MLAESTWKPQDLKRVLSFGLEFSAGGHGHQELSLRFWLRSDAVGLQDPGCRRQPPALLPVLLHLTPPAQSPWLGPGACGMG